MSRWPAAERGHRPDPLLRSSVAEQGPDKARTSVRFRPQRPAPWRRLKHLLPEECEELADLLGQRTVAPSFGVHGRGIPQIQLEELFQLSGGFRAKDDRIDLVVEQDAPVIEVR